MYRKKKRETHVMINSLPVSGSEAELHCSIAAAAWFCLPSDSYVLIFATVRG